MLGSRDFEREIARLRGRMNEILNDASVEMKQSEPLDESEWMPPVDVLENKDEILVKADIPGMSPDEIDLSISGNVLLIKGERKREVERKDENYHNIERGFGKFVRRVSMPAPLNADAKGLAWSRWI